MNEPATAEKLIPKDHGYGMKRPPMETGYYEAYNRPNVTLVDLHATPIERDHRDGDRHLGGRRGVRRDHLGHGLRRRDRRAHPYGSGRHRRSAADDLWADGPRTYLGIAVPRFPNLLFVGGPHFPFANVPRGAEIQVDFVADLVCYVFERGIEPVEPEEAAEETWTEHVVERRPFLVADTAVVPGCEHPGQGRRLHALHRRPRELQRPSSNEVADNGYERLRAA